MGETKKDEVLEIKRGAIRHRYRTLSNTDAQPERVFVLTLAGKPGSNPIHALRWLLKLALRRFGLRCIDVREVGNEVVQTRS